MLNKAEQSKEDSIFSMKLQPEIKALKMQQESKEFIEKFVGDKEDGTPARQEITKHLQFLSKELKRICSSKKNDCFLINQRLFYYC
jgi:hypothetical protein